MYHTHVTTVQSILSTVHMTPFLPLPSLSLRKESWFLMIKELKDALNIYCLIYYNVIVLVSVSSDPIVLATTPTRWS